MADPFARFNEGLAGMQNTMTTLANLRRQEKQDAQTASLQGLQTQQAQQGLEEGQLRLSALRAQPEADVQKQQMEKSKFAFDGFTKVADAVHKGLIDETEAGAFYRNAMKMSGVDLASAGVDITFSKKGGFFSGPVTPETLFMVDGKPVPYGAVGTIEKARIVGIDPQTNKPIYEMTESTTFKEPQRQTTDYKSRERIDGNSTVFEESLDGGRTWKQVSSGPRYKPASGVATGSTGKPSKPLPVPALKMQQEGVDAIGTASGIRADLGELRMQVETGALDLGPMKNLWNKARNWSGWSSPQSRNLQSFTAMLQKLRNDSLRLNKGVQTDGDAQRAWAELIDNINDPLAVSQRLQEIDAINERAVLLHQANIDNVRNNYGLGPLDTSVQRNAEPSIGKGGGNASKNKDKRPPLSAIFGKGK